MGRRGIQLSASRAYAEADRIVIFEDEDGDGRFDKRRVFYDKLNYVTGIEVGFGGVWVMSPPYFYYIPDENRDDIPDSAPQVLLDGFGTHANAHNLANGLAWGPDGWLYGTHGRTNWSRPAKPGTPEEQRARFDGGVYRYHPTRHIWEPYADGTTNPWGIDWNDFGHAFVCNCVNPHLFQVIQGAHYEPWRNRESSRYAYERIPTIADHLHFLGRADVRIGLGSPAEDDLGGGHAHCGTMIYLGDNWPDKYRNTVFMNNIHGHRINNDLLRRRGSGYVASHGDDLMVSKDRWYMGVSLAYGPDGGVFASDWSDTGECHSVKNTRRHTGRIYKITHGSPNWRPVDLASRADAELVRFQHHRNDWFVRHARRLLQERAAAGRDMTDVHVRLREMFFTERRTPQKLRALWALHVTDGIDDAFLTEQLKHRDENVRAWAIQLLCEDRSPPEAALTRFLELAEQGESQLARLHLASAMQRLEAAQRWRIVEALSGRSEDVDDANLPLMVWYAAEPLVHDDARRFVRLATHTSWPLMRRHIARRAATLADARIVEELVQVLDSLTSREGQTDLLEGMLLGFSGRRSIEIPTSWPQVYSNLQVSREGDQAVRRLAIQVALVFDDPHAIVALRERARDVSLSPPLRREAIEALVSKRVRDLPPLLLQLLDDEATRSAAIRGLADYNHSPTADVLVQRYDTFDTRCKMDAVQTLASRANWAVKLLDAVQSGRIPRSDLTAYTARQLRNLGDPRLVKRLRELWGELRVTPADKQQQIQKYKTHLTPENLARADLSDGRFTYERTCAKCHRLFGDGQDIGPELTGAQRGNLDYILENLIDPSAAVSRDYQMDIIHAADGRILTGLVIGENANSLTLQTLNERVVLSTEEVERRRKSDSSMMPDGLLQALTNSQVRNLVAYLASPVQVALPEIDGHDE